MHLPNRKSLVIQMSEILREEIERGRWGEWLPEERELARNYQVSRFTLRKALDRLREEGMLETRHGLGTRVASTSRPRSKRAANATIGVLMPRALDRFRHFITLVVDDLRTLLFDHGHQLLVHVHPQVESRRPLEFLKKLTNQQRHACWLLVGCGPEAQRWFSQNRIPAVVSGSCDPALGLPFVCLDNHALGRHAGLTLLQHGHRHVGALLTHSNPALRTGLDAIFAPQSAHGASMTVCEVDETTAGVARAVDRLLALQRRPKAFFIAESSMYLAVLSRLAQLRLRVPDDVSLLCRDDEHYLTSLLPEPARYSKDPHAYAKLLLTHLLKMLNHEPVAHQGTYVMPEFVAGGSLNRLSGTH
jgi:DNA-binding LacI/PurR family transcriptional regulator